MSEAVRTRCLEPFFTTKGERGTGLGLAMVYGMVQRHSADFEIESATGCGTTMRLIFAESVPRLAPAVSSQALRVSLASLRILIVDDDPVVIRSLEDTLQA